MAVEEYEQDCKEYNEFKSVAEKHKQQQQQQQKQEQQQSAAQSVQAAQTQQPPVQGNP